MSSDRIQVPSKPLSPESVAAILRSIGSFIRGLRQGEHGDYAFALCLLAASHLQHDGGTLEDFLQFARAAWERGEKNHHKEGQ